jgi:hypothetical protein
MTLEVLSAIKGHSEIYFEEKDPTKRKELAETITKLLKDGYAVFLIQNNETRQVRGYDSDTNEWIVVATPHEVPQPIQWRKRGYSRVPSQGGRLTAVAATAGG